MKKYLIVDGYNVINAWRDVFDLDRITLEDSRQKLLNILSDYQGYSGMGIIVVFDAHMVANGLGSIASHDNIRVIYTKENQTADEFIERFVKNHGAGISVTVVTADYLEQRTVFSKGGLRMTPGELKDEIFAKRDDGKIKGAGKKQRDFLENRLTGEQRSMFEALRRARDELD
jgi:hypothetical protein